MSRCRSRGTPPNRCPNAWRTMLHEIAASRRRIAAICCGPVAVSVANSVKSFKLAR
jgi:hypothetical protein